MMKRWRKWGLLGLAVLLVTVGGGWLYAQTPHAGRMVSRSLAQRFGVTTSVASVGVGMTRTSLNALAIHERDAAPDAIPWLRVAEAQADVSALGAILGSEPSTVVLKEAHVHLRFDRKGDLLTKFPQSSAGTGPLPNLRIQSATLTIQQEGHKDSVFRGIDITTTTTDNAITLQGTLEDAAWGKWQAGGTVDFNNKQAQFKFTTLQQQHVTQELLESTPFVNPNAWKAVKLEGDTAAVLTLNCNLTTEEVTYQMTMQPKNTRVFVPLIGLTVTEATGTLVAEGATVTLKAVSGKTSGGTVLVDSKMNFGGIDDVLSFSTDFKNAEVKKLPLLWSVPKEIDGKLGGHLDFTIAILAKGGIRTNGQGTATITDAKLNGLPTEPIELKMKPSPFGLFVFSRVDPKDASKGPKGNGVQEMPKKVNPEPKPNAKLDKPGQAAGLFTGLLQIASNIIKPKDAPKEERDYLHVNLTFRDINFVELLKTAKITLPLNVSGKTTVQMQVDIPTLNPDEMANYRLSGTISSARLNVEGIDLVEASAKLRLKDGTLHITDLNGRLPLLGNEAKGGDFTGNISIELGKNYAFTGAMQFDKLDLHHVEQLKSILPLPFAIGGEAVIKADLKGTFSPMNVATVGKLTVKQLQIGGLPIDEVAFSWQSSMDKVTIDDLTATLLTGEVSGAFTIPLNEAHVGDGHLKLKDVDLAALSKALPTAAGLKLEGKANGVVNLRVPAAGEGVPRVATAEVELTAPKLKLQEIMAEKIKGSGSFTSGVLNYKFVGEALGGTFELEGQFPPNAKKEEPKPKEKQPGFLEGFRSLKFKNVKLSQLLARFGQTSTLGSLEAEITGDIPFTLNAALQLTGVGKIRMDRLRWGNVAIASTGQGTLRLTGKELRLEDGILPMGEGFANVAIALNRLDIDRSTASLTLSNVPAKRLFFLFPDFAGQIDCNVDGRLSSNIGREWRGSGVLTAIKGKIYGIPIADVRFPLSWVANFDRQWGTVSLADMTGTAAKGRTTGKAEVTFFADQPTKLSGEIKFTNLNAASAFTAAGNITGNAPISGKFTFGSDHLRTAKDLTGKLEATLGGDAQPFGLPVFSSVVPFLGLGRDAATIVNAGEVKATLGNGVWRVQQLTLTGGALNVYAEGTITTSGRINGFVAGSTGRTGLTPTIGGRIGALASQLTTAPLSRNSLNEALGVLGNFVIYLDVTGTIDAPIVKLQTVRTLSEGAVRFLLMQYAPR